MPGALETWDAKAVQDWLTEQPALGKYTGQLEVSSIVLETTRACSPKTGHHVVLMDVLLRRELLARTSCASPTTC